MLSISYAQQAKDSILVTDLDEVEVMGGIILKLMVIILKKFQKL